MFCTVDLARDANVTDSQQLELNPVTTTWPRPRDLCTTPTGNSFPPSCFRRVDVRQYMRSYWVNGLYPERTYQFCLGYVRQTDGWLVPLECGSVTTLVARRRHDRRPYAPTLMSVLVVVLIAAPCVFCFLTALVRRYRRRKQYKEPPTGPGVRSHDDPLCSRQSETCGMWDAACRVAVADEDGGRMEASRRRRPAQRTLRRGQGDGVSSPIPLDCLYDLPSTPLSTSTSQTSLITHA